MKNIENENKHPKNSTVKLELGRSLDVKCCRFDGVKKLVKNLFFHIFSIFTS